MNIQFVDVRVSYLLQQFYGIRVTPDLRKLEQNEEEVVFVFSELADTDTNKSDPNLNHNTNEYQ